MTTLAEVRLWGRTIGAVSLVDGEHVADFEYNGEFLGSGIQIAPLHMPLSRRIYSFPALPRQSFHGLPGLLADSLPDRFGNALIDAWLATQGRTSASFNAVERLCYTGARGMGALEFLPATFPQADEGTQIHLDRLVELASAVVDRHSTLRVFIDGDSSDPDQSQAHALADILKVGTSAGGARAKATIAWNRETNEVRSGHVPASEGFEHWLLKFDGVRGNRDKELADPQGYGAIEYAYSHMATAAGISMSECRLFEENGRRHFMTRRFDRLPSGAKVHMQSLAAMGHFDFNLPGAYSYEEALNIMRHLGMPMSSIEEQFRRMAFNIIARNQDDHVKNIAFLMDKAGTWSLSPAFDVIYSFNPQGAWTSLHQMTMNGKRDNFVLDDFKACARTASMKRGRAAAIVGEVEASVAKWPVYADTAAVPPAIRDSIASTLRTIPR